MSAAHKAAAGTYLRSALRTAAVCLLCALPAACAHRAPPPRAEATQQRPINLSGLTVMVLPAQPTASTPESVARAFDDELAFWLGERAPRVHWVPARELERLASSSPALRMDLHALDVRAFGRMRVDRIGDPLFGDIHNLGAVVDARLALLPATVAYVLPSAGDAGRIEVTGALIETFSGDIVWYGVVAGDPGPIDAPAGPASAAQALARALTPGN